MTPQNVIDKIQQAYDEKAEFLDLGGCGLTAVPEEIVMLAPFLTRLSLGNCYYDLEGNQINSSTPGRDNEFSGLVRSFDLLSSFKSLRTLCLNRVSLSPDNLTRFPVFRNINRLQITSNELGNKGAAAVSNLDNLHSLSIQDNKLTAMAGRSLSRLRNLQYLNVNYNKLSDKGALAFGQMDQLQSLSIGGNGVTSRGMEAILSLTGLTRLDIHNNYKITDEVFAGLKRLEQLAKLIVRGIYLTEAKLDTIGQLGQLTSLEIHFNEVGVHGAEVISGLSNLTTLSAIRAGFTDQGMELISRLGRLTMLHVARNLLSDRGAAAIARLSNLTSLDLGHNELTGEGAKAIGELKGLTYLNISNNKLAGDGVAGIGRLQQLISLDMNNNQVGAAGGEAVGRLHRLTSLRIGNNQLTDQGAEHIGRLSNLTYLEIGSNQLTAKGAEAISRLKKLTALDIPGNALTDEGAGHLGRLDNLLVLNTYATQLTDKGAAVLSGLKKLRKLNIGRNFITAIGARALGALDNLVDLHIERCQLGPEGAEAIGQMHNLESLHIGENQLGDQGAEALSDLPLLDLLAIDKNLITDKGAIALSRLPHVRSFFIYDNQLTNEGAIAISRMPFLEGLNISGNLLGDEGIEAIVKNPKIHWTLVRDNKPEAIPAEILENLDALRAYFNSTEKVDNTLVKIILIGNTTAGKSSLANFLAHGKHDPSIESTHGIQLWKWKIKEKEYNLQVNIWDLGGQDYYHATHNIFLDNKTLYLFLDTPRDIHDTKAEAQQYLPPGYWLGNIDSLTNKENIKWYIQSKADLYEPQHLDSALVKKYNVKQQYFVSVQKAAGKERKHLADFAYFHRNLCEELTSLASGKLPVSWVMIRDQWLPRWRKEELFYTVDKFREQCLAALQKDEVALRDLKQTWDGLLPYLKGCGEIVYFPGNPVLKDLVFLSAEKLTDGIYTLLSKKVRENQGVFTLDMLQQDERRHADVYMKVLLAFGLVFEKTGQPRIYVAPQYLPENSNASHLQRVMELAFVIHFPEYMSRSLIARFLVRYAGHLADNHYWRYGAFFELDGYHVFVRIDVEAQKVYVHTDKEERKRYDVLKEMLYAFTVPLFLDLSSDNWKSLRELPTPVRKGTPKIEWHFYTWDDSVVETDDQWSARVEGGFQTQIQPDIELSPDDIHFAPVAQLREAIDTKADKVKSLQGGFIELNDILYHLLKNPKTMARKIFLSYSHKDEAYKAELDTHFAALKRSGKIATWNDRVLKPGDDWDATIKEALQQADIMLLLLSPDFMASEYIWNVEIPAAQKQGIHIVPIFLRPCDFKETVFELHKKQGLPNDARWIVNNQTPHRDEAYLEVVNGIKRLLND